MMFRVLFVVGVLSCVIPCVVGQSSQQIVYTHFSNSNCYLDGSQYTHTFADRSCQYDHLTSTGPYKYIRGTIVTNSTIQLCFSDLGCYGSTNVTCATYPTNQCMWDLSGSSWRLSIAPVYPTPVPTLRPTLPPTTSPSQTIIYTHYTNRWCYDDPWSFSHSWASGVCQVDHLEASGNYTSILATLEYGTQVELCQYSDALYHCDYYHYVRCDHYILNTCYQTSNTSWIRFTTGANPYPTTYPPTVTPSPTPRPTTQPPPVLGQTIIYTAYNDRYCGIQSQVSHNWMNGSCLMDTFDYYSSINIKPRIVSRNVVEMCFHYDYTAHCDGDFSSCRMYQTDTCITNPNSYTSFRVQIYGANTIPTPTPTPTPTRPPTSNPNQPVFLYTHYDDNFCTMVTQGYPHAWDQQTLQYEYLGGQVLPFNATLLSPTSAWVCLMEPSMSYCQFVLLNVCVTGPQNSGQFMLQLINSTMIPTPTIVPTGPPTTPPATPPPTPTPYPVGAVNIINTRYNDANCTKLDPFSKPEIFVNGECDTKPFNNNYRQVKVNLLAGALSVLVCESDSECLESRMACRPIDIGACTYDAPTSLHFQYTLSGTPTSSPDSSSSGSSGLSTGVLVGLIAGGVVALILLIGIISYCRKHQRRLKEQALHMQQDGGYTRV